MSKWVLGVILLLALFLRVLGLSGSPAGFTPDEASFGYDAYSILNTGRDQWGNVLPLVLKSFGDYKMPLYAYLAIPSVAIFGLTEFAVRLPNALLGTAAVLVTYFLANEFIGKRGLGFWNLDFGILASLLLAISPWHIQMSRGAFEANLTTFFLPLTIFLFLKGLKDSRYFVFSAFFAGLNLFSYHSARLVTPLIFLFLILRYWHQIKKDKFARIATEMAFFAIALTALTYLMGAGARVGSSGIFNLAGQAGEARFEGTQIGLPDLFARAFNNKATALFTIFTRNYLAYFSPQFLFTQGAGETTYGMIPGRGLLYLAEVVFVIGFLFALATKKFKNQTILIFWLLVAPLPAALSIGPGFAANRAAIMVPAVQIASALGAVYLYQKITRQGLKSVFIYSSILLFLSSFAFFLEDYFVQQKLVGAKAMIYGARDVVESVSKVEKNYSLIIVSKKISEPHIYFAFYNQFNPKDYQKILNELSLEQYGISWVDQIPIYNFDRYVFKNIDWKFDSKIENALVIGTPEDFPNEVSPLKVIYYPNQKPAFYLVDSVSNSFAWTN